jgi:hypothetical protein
MELIERYLQAVKFWLPKRQAKDILAELSDDLRSQVEEKQAELGRTLNDTELEVMLKRCGHPMVAGGRYLPQQYLIGPAVFPTYWLLMKIIFLWILVPVFALIIGPIVFAASSHDTLSIFGSLWGSFWITAFIAFCTITLLFATLERYQVKVNLFENWNPAKLPRLRAGRRIPYSSSIVEIAFGVLAILWWTSIVQFPAVYGIERAGIHNWSWGSVWLDFSQTYFLPVLFLLFAGVAIGCLNLARPVWTRSRWGMRAAVDLISAGILSSVLIPHWSAFTAMSRLMIGEHAGMPRMEFAANVTNMIVYMIMLVAALIYAGQGVYDILRFVRLNSDLRNQKSDISIRNTEV